MRQIIGSEKFIDLSANLSYQLSAAPTDWMAVLELMLPNPFPDESVEILIETMQYLGNAYGTRRRRLGPLSILHPIRAAALLAMVFDSPPMLDILTALLHDKEEDLSGSMFTPEQQSTLAVMFRGILGRLSDNDRWFLEERIHFLTRRENERYYKYLGTLLGQATMTRELVRVKLADRLDNTFDMKMSVERERTRVDPYKAIFARLFVKSYKAQERHPHHVRGVRLKGDAKLYQLFKNAVLLSLVRKSGLDRMDESTSVLFDALASASANEALEVVCHVFTYHLQDAEQQRNILMDVMNYCQKGGIESVTGADSGHRLDGLFLRTFDPPERSMLKQALSDLYKDKARMAEAAIVFSAIFESFRYDPAYRIRGIDSDGIHPMDPGRV